MSLPRDINDREHGKFKEVSLQTTVAVTPIDGATPLEGNNSSYSLTYNASDQLTQIDKIIGTITYRKILTWTGDVMTASSAWVEV